MPGLPLLRLRHVTSGEDVHVRAGEYSNGDPLYLCGRGDCPHYVEQRRLSFADGGEREGTCRLVQMAVTGTCVALDIETIETLDATYRAACSIEQAAAIERDRQEVVQPAKESAS